MVAVNRDMLLAIAGAFFMLPSLIFAVVVPEPQMPRGIEPADAFRLMSDYYYGSLPFLLGVTVLQMAGMLTLIIVMTDRSLPTVGQAIKRGFSATLPYLLAQMLLAFALAFGLVVLSTVGTLTGIKAVAAALTILGMVMAIHFFLRFLLIAPILATGPQRNPLAVLRQSWALTRGQSSRMAMFFGLALLLFLIISGLVMMLVGIVLALTTQGELQRVLAATVSSAMTAVGLTYFAGMLAAVHRQLTDGNADRPDTPSETPFA